jgi:hypothetical protein
VRAEEESLDRRANSVQNYAVAIARRGWGVGARAPIGVTAVAALIACMGVCLPAFADTGQRGARRPSLVVLDLGGSAADVETRVRAQAERRFRWVRESTYQAEARRQKIERVNRRSVARVARSIGVDYVVEGAVRGRRHRHVVLRIRDGQTGKVVARARLVARHTRGKRLDRGLGRALSKVESAYSKREQRRNDLSAEVRDARATRTASVGEDERGYAVDDEVPDFKPARYR